MKKLIQDFVVEDKRKYKFKVGKTVASSLSGFIAGFVCASIIFYTYISYNF